MEDWIGGLSAVQTTVLAAVIGSCAAIIAGFISGLFALIAPWGNQILLRGYYKRIFVSELNDIIRHCEANSEIMLAIQKKNGVPARMHIEKMLIFETGMIFDNEMLTSMPPSLQKRLVGVRVAARNINFELTDTITQVFDRGLNSKDELHQRFHYHLDKFRYLQERLLAEVAEVTKKPELSYRERSREIIIVKPFGD